MHLLLKAEEQVGAYLEQKEPEKVRNVDYMQQSVDIHKLRKRLESLI